MRVGPLKVPQMAGRWVSDVEEFITTKLPYVEIPARPSMPSHEQRLENIASISSEFNELISALNSGDLVELIDGCCDTIYTIIGLALRCGVDLTPHWAEVQRSNMDKYPAAGGTMGRRQADGSSMKPDGWVGPRIAELLEQQGL